MSDLPERFRRYPNETDQSYFERMHPIVAKEDPYDIPHEVTDFVVSILDRRKEGLRSDPVPTGGRPGYIERFITPTLEDVPQEDDLAGEPEDVREAVERAEAGQTAKQLPPVTVEQFDDAMVASGEPSWQKEAKSPSRSGPTGSWMAPRRSRRPTSGLATSLARRRTR